MWGSEIPQENIKRDELMLLKFENEFILEDELQSKLDQRKEELKEFAKQYDYEVETNAEISIYSKEKIFNEIIKGRIPVGHSRVTGKAIQCVKVYGSPTLQEEKVKRISGRIAGTMTTTGTVICAMCIAFLI